MKRDLKGAERTETRHTTNDTQACNIWAQLSGLPCRHCCRRLLRPGLPRRRQQVLNICQPCLAAAAACCACCACCAQAAAVLQHELAAGARNVLALLSPNGAVDSVLGRRLGRGGRAGEARGVSSHE